MRCPTLTELPPPPPGRTGWPWTEESPQLPDTMPDSRPWPRVSIVTPSYNQAQFIEETIRSVLLQGYPDLEYIIMDGGSTDGSVEIIRKYTPWLAYWTSEKDKGQADAINKGWQRSTGEALAWLNSDDTYAPGAISTAVGRMERHPEVAVLVGDCQIIDDQGRVLRLQPAGDFDCVTQLFTDTLLQPGIFMRRDAVESVGWLDANLQYVMDWELWYRLWFAGYRIQRSPGVPLANFRCWPDSKSTSKPLKFSLERIQVLDKLYATLTLPPEMQEAKGAVYCCEHLRAGLHCQMLGDLQAARTHVSMALAWSRQIRGPWPGWSFLAGTLAAEPEHESHARRFAHLLHTMAQDHGVTFQDDDIYPELIASAYIVKAWEGYQQGNLAKVRRHLWQVWRWRPAALLDRGLLSIGLESVVGPGLMRRLRAVSHVFQRRRQGTHAPRNTPRDKRI